LDADRFRLVLTLTVAAEENDMAHTRQIVDWRKALKEGKTAGSIWSGRGNGDHLKNQHQRVDSDKTAVAAGNQYGSVHVKAYKTHGVILIKGPDGKTIQKIPFGTPPASAFGTIPPVL
jgi:hypothetical protein